MNTSKPNWSDVLAARQLVQRHFARTRLVPAPSLNTHGGAEVHLKLESDMPTGSFKVRGAVHALRCEIARRPVAEVVASSTGNHGAAVAYAAKLLITLIFQPEQQASPSKYWNNCPGSARFGRQSETPR